MYHLLHARVVKINQNPCKITNKPVIEVICIFTCPFLHTRGIMNRNKIDFRNVSTYSKIKTKVSENTFN